MIIGVTGSIGAGKGTVVDYFIAKGFKRYAVSDTFLAGEAVKRGLEPDRVARRNIANEYRAKGPTKLQEAVYDMAVAAGDAENDIVIEPQHTKAEVEFIREKGGIVIAVDADIELRYERISGRGSSKDNVSFEEFSRHDQVEMASDDANKNNLRDSIEAADVTVMNNGTVEELHAKIEEALAKLR